MYALYRLCQKTICQNTHILYATDYHWSIVLFFLRLFSKIISNTWTEPDSQRQEWWDSTKTVLVSHLTHKQQYCAESVHTCSTQRRICPAHIRPHKEQDLSFHSLVGEFLSLSLLPINCCHSHLVYHISLLTISCKSITISVIMSHSSPHSCHTHLSLMSHSPVIVVPLTYHRCHTPLSFLSHSPVIVVTLTFHRCPTHLSFLSHSPARAFLSHSPVHSCQSHHVFQSQLSIILLVYYVTTIHYANSPSHPRSPSAT